MKTTSAVPAIAPHRGHANHTLAPELGLHGIPSRSLVEFEGGGSMLSRDILGEMLAGNAAGVLHERKTRAGRVAGEGKWWERAKHMKEQDAVVAARRGRHGVIDGGPTEVGKQARLLCQADALAWLRETARVDLGWPDPCRSDGSRRWSAVPHHNSSSHGVVNQQGSHSYTAAGTRAANTDNQGVILPSTATRGTARVHASPPTGGRRRSPMAARSRSRSPVKLYDHDNNPRVLRSLVDDTVTSGLAGGVLKTEEEQRFDDLKRQLRLANHHATELEDRIFQSQTGAPHRELLGELHLDLQRTPNILGSDQRRYQSWSTQRPIEKLSTHPEKLAPTGFVQRTGTRPRPRPRNKNEELRPFRRAHDVQLPVRNVSTDVSSRSPNKNREPKRDENVVQPSSTPAFDPPVSPSSPSTPTTSLRRYLSSLRPFSADSARAAWGLAEPGGYFDGSEWDPSSSRSGDPDVVGNFGRGPLWPVLFFIGDAKRPTARHPLGVYSLPLFDERLLRCLQEASGEPIDRVRTATRVLFRFDLSRFQASMMKLCRTQSRTSSTNALQPMCGGDENARRAPEQTHGTGTPHGQAAQVWVRDQSGALLGGVASSPGNVWKKTSVCAEGYDDPIVLSEAAASQALSTGFLSGVFGDRTIEAVVRASRPLVVFDSGRTSDSELELSTARGISPTERAVDTTIATTSPSEVKLGCRNPAVAPLDRVCDGEDVTKRAQPSQTREVGVVIVDQLVKAAAVEYRIYNVAIGLCYNESRRSFSCSPSMRAFDSRSSRNVLVGGHDGTYAAGSGGEFRGIRDRSRKQRPASADSDELGLPPLKLRKGDTRGAPRRSWGVGQDNRPGDATVGPTSRPAAESMEEQEDTFSFVRPRSTPRCLRPGFKGDVTTAMLRQELEASENTAARLGISMARKAEAWTRESQPSQIAAAVAARVAMQNAALELAGTRAREALIEAAKTRMRKAVEIMYLGLIRRSWTAWIDVTRHRRSLDSAKRLTRLVGAAAIGHGVLEPLLRRRQRTWLRRWAAAMRAERVLEVQAASVELQRVARGFLGREYARTVKQNRGAVAMQRIVRGCAGRARAARRARYLQELRAARTIETKYREFVWHRQAATLRKLRRHERAATTVQAIWRGCILGRRPVRRLRQRQRRERSALMVQRPWRGVIARMEADVLLDAKNQREAAVKIQAAARARRARNYYKYAISRERAATSLACFWRCVVAKAETTRRRNNLRLALAVNPLVRGFLGRLVVRSMREENYRNQRAILVACVFAQKIFRGKQGRLKARRELLRNCAAVELQRMVRRHRMRRISAIENSRIKTQLATWAAAVAVQRLWRGLTERRKFGQRAAEEARSRAAFTIQSAYRRMRFRRARRLRRRLASPAGRKGTGTRARGGADRGKSRSPRRGHKAGNATISSIHDDSSAGVGSAYSENSQVGGSENDVGEESDERSRTSDVSAGDQHQRDFSSAREYGDEEFADGGSADLLDAEDAPDPDNIYEDMGDVALAALVASRQVAVPEEQTPVPQEDLTPLKMTPGSASGAGSPHALEVVPAVEATLAYYEAKQRYLAAQQAAYGASAVKIQNMVRVFAAKKKVAAARALIREIAELKARRERAAVTLQKEARGRAARKVAAEKRAVLEEAERQRRSAITLQCAVRCFVAKRRLMHLRAEDKARRDRLDSMAARIQARVRGIQTRNVWRKFFNSRALLERERQRRGAQKIQCMWRSRLATTEAARRKSVRDEAILAELLERHLQTLLQPALEAERRHAYAVRLQCWWRKLLAEKVRRLRGKEMRETPILENTHEEERAAIVIQSHMRAARARRFYNENYVSLFRERERKKYCTECQGEYATRKCDTCLDKFCDSCWVRIHGKGARRFHHWEPFVTFSYDAVAPQRTSSVAEDSWADPQQQRQQQQQQQTGYDHSVSGYYGYFPDWDGQSNTWGMTETAAGAGTELAENASTGQQQWPTEYSAEEEYSYYGGADSYYGGQYDYSTGGAAGETPPTTGDYYSQGGYPQEQQYTEAVKGSDVTEYSGAWAGEQYGEGAYGGAAPYDTVWDGAAGGQQQLTPTAHDGSSSSPHHYDDSNDGVSQYHDWNYSDTHDSGTPNQMLADGTITTRSAEGGEFEPRLSYGAYEGAEAYDHNQASPDASYLSPTYENNNASDWPQGWTGPGSGSNDVVDVAANGNAMFGSEAAAGDARGTDSGSLSAGTAGTSSGRQWSVNEYGQRCCGDWVEYWDENAQAGYFYNTVTGEASWTEPATG